MGAMLAEQFEHLKNKCEFNESIESTAGNLLGGTFFCQDDLFETNLFPDDVRHSSGSWIYMKSGFGEGDKTLVFVFRDLYDVPMSVIHENKVYNLAFFLENSFVYVSQDESCLSKNGNVWKKNDTFEGESYRVKGVRLGLSRAAKRKAKRKTEIFELKHYVSSVLKFKKFNTI